MAVSVGGNRLDIAPLGRDGNLPGVRGNHRGPAAGLNLHGARPGYVYYWCRHPRADRRGAQYQRFLNMGWRPVPPDGPEYKAQEQSLNYSQLGLDSYQVHGDLVLMQMPEPRYRQLCEWRQEAAKSELEGPTNEYLSKARDFDSNYGARADGPIYYRGQGHGTRIEEK